MLAACRTTLTVSGSPAATTAAAAACLRSDRRTARDADNRPGPLAERVSRSGSISLSEYLAGREWRAASPPPACWDVGAGFALPGDPEARSPARPAIRWDIGAGFALPGDPEARSPARPAIRWDIGAGFALPGDPEARSPARP